MNRGTTLLETLVGLAISSLTLSVGTVLFMRYQMIYQAESERHREISALSVFRGHFQRIVSNIDTLRHHTTPIIHTKGLVKQFDGSPHSIMQLGSSSRPKIGEDAISSIELSAAHALEVRSSKTTAGLIYFDVCPRYKANRKIERPKSFLAFSFDAAYQLTPSVSSRIYFEKCSTLELLKIPGIFFKTPSIKTIQDTLLLIPITSEFTIYIDRSDQLRYISHTGLRIQENQPILRNIEKLSFNLENLVVEHRNYLKLNSRIKLRGRKSKPFESNNLLSRVNSLYTLYARGK